MCQAYHLSRRVQPSMVCVTECGLEDLLMRSTWPTGGGLLCQEKNVSCSLLQQANFFVSFCAPSDSGFFFFQQF